MWYVYIRMSHRQSAESGISEEVQLQVALDWLRSNSVYPSLGKSKFPDEAPAGVFVDRAESGWSKDFHERPAGLALLRVLKPGDHIVFYNVERSFRNTLNCLRWIGWWSEQGVTPHFIMENVDFTTAGGRFVGTIMAAAAQYYSDLMSERIREAKAIKRLRLGEVSTKVKAKVEWLPSDTKSAPVEEQIIKSTGTCRVYNRVSDHDQKLSGLSMEHQRNTNLNYGMRQIVAGKATGMCVYEDESVSSFTKKFTDRPAASRLFGDLKAGDHVIVHRTDRAFRNIRDAVETEATMRDMGVYLHLTKEGISTDTEYGRMFFHILAIFAELESSIKRRRKLDMNNYLRGQGRPTGSVMRHQKIVKSGSYRKLSHDFDAIKETFVLWILREAGFSVDEACAYTMAIRGKRLGKLPVNARLRQSRGKKCFPIQDPKHTARMLHNLDAILNELPEELAKDLVSAAILAIQSPVDPLCFRYCLFPVRFPVVDIEDRLIAHGNDARLLRLLPIHAQFATAPA